MADVCVDEVGRGHLLDVQLDVEADESHGLVEVEGAPAPGVDEGLDEGGAEGAARVGLGELRQRGGLVLALGQGVGGLCQVADHRRVCSAVRCSGRGHPRGREPQEQQRGRGADQLRSPGSPLHPQPNFDRSTALRQSALQGQV